MRKILTAGIAALTLGGAVAGAAAPAQADPYWRGGWHGGGGWHHDDDAGVAIAAGVLGLAAGAALAGGYHPHYYYGPDYYEPGYYPPPGYYGYATCVGHRRVWDPYYGGYVIRSFRYAC